VWNFSYPSGIRAAVHKMAWKNRIVKLRTPNSYAQRFTMLHAVVTREKLWNPFF
jgi:hypothetical protein